MIGEIDLAGLFVSPLLICMLAAFIARLALSRLLEAVGLYRFIWQRPLFDLSLFFILLCSIFYVFRTFAG